MRSVKVSVSVRVSVSEIVMCWSSCIEGTCRSNVDSVCWWLQLLRSYDKKDDCDLWKDGMFRAKNLRYICISRDAEVNAKIVGVPETNV